jgi:hypothetical protein
LPELGKCLKLLPELIAALIAAGKLIAAQKKRGPIALEPLSPRALLHAAAARLGILLPED